MKKVGELFRETLVNNIEEGIKNNTNTFLINYTQVSGQKISDFRKQLKKTGARLYVTKNSVAKIALKQLEFDELANTINNQTAFVWGDKDSVEIAKTVVDFTKDSDNIVAPGGVLEGKILSQDDVKALSDLPSREVLLSMLLSAIQSPLTRLAGALNAKTRELLSILKQLSEKKGGN